MIASGFLLKPLATVLARAVLTKLLKAELTTSDIAETLTDSLGISDLIDRLTNDEYAKQSANLFFIRIGRSAATSLEEVFRMDGSDLAPALVEQTAQALAETLQARALPLLLEKNLDKGSFDVALRKVKPPTTLASEAHDLFQSALLASSERIFAVADTLPNFTRDTAAEVLTRLTESHEVLQEIQQKLIALAESQRQSIENNPANQQDRIFEQKYRALILLELDQMELFGISDIDSNYRPPISAAFIHLRAVAAKQEEKEHLSHQRKQGIRLNVAQAVTQAQRILIAGDAGMGKTTLLRWLAVRLAAPGTGKQADELDRWRGKIPIYLRLRDFPRGNFPDFDQLPIAFPSFKELKGLLRPGWTSTLLDTGRCVLLFDGLDEVTLKQCRVALDWLEKLLYLYPDKLTCIVTTRYSTLEKPGIEQRFTKAGFQRLNLAKMGPSDITGFVKRWHGAMQDPRVGLPDVQFAKLQSLEKGLLETLGKDALLLELANTPLLCAMICAVNQRRNGNLPANRLELYKLCTEMLLAARDEIRGVDRSDHIQLSGDRLQAQVARLAYWMMENDLRVVKRSDAVHQLGLDLEKNDGNRVLTLLIERCLLLREQSKNELEFVHGSFQEYLAATEILYRNDIGKVCKRYGAENAWKETILLLASHGLDEERQITLLSKLQDAAKDPDKRRSVHILALEAFSLMRRHSLVVRDIARQHAEALVVVNQTDDKTTVQLLDLEGTQVSDVSALSKLTALTELYLDNTQVSDVSALSKLTGLTSLSLINTQVSDVSALSKLTALTSLSLINTQVSDVSALSKLTALTELYLANTQVSDVSALSKLTALTSLNLDNTQVSDVTALSKLTALTSLNLDNTHVSDVTALSKLTALTWLSLTNTQVSDVSALSKLTALTSLYLDNTQVSDVTALSKLTALTLLNLANTQVSDVSALSKLTGLTSLNLDNTQVSDVSALSKLTGLTSLNLGNTQVSDVTALATLPMLQLLEIRKTRVATLESMGKLPDLWAVDLRECPVTDFSSLLASSSLRAIWLDDTTLLPADWPQQIAINQYGIEPRIYWHRLRAEKRQQQDSM